MSQKHLSLLAIFALISMVCGDASSEPPASSTTSTTKKPAAPGAVPAGADSDWRAKGIWEKTTLKPVLLCVPKNNESIQNCENMVTQLKNSSFHVENKLLNVTSAECMYYAAKENITANTTIRCVVEATYNGTSGVSDVRFNLYNEKFNESSTILAVGYWGKGNISTEAMTPLVNATAS